MLRRIISGIMLTLLFLFMLTLVFNLQPVEASETIYIRADGSIEGTTDISTVDNVTYTFTDNIYDEIVVERDNIVVDGAGYTLQGTGSGTGIDLSDRSNVTIKNTGIKRFMYCIYLDASSNNNISNNNISEALGTRGRGIYLDGSSNNTISGNIITENTYGIRLETSSNNSVSRNHIKNSHWGGISLSYSSNNTISGNNVTNTDAGGGIGVSYSSNNVISGNNIKYHETGLFIVDSSKNTISGNNVTNNRQGGIEVKYSSNNTFRNNDASNNNAYNFGVEPYWPSSSLSHYIHDIDDSNTVDGKPVYYWINRRDLVVPLDAGYVALINCTNITVNNLLILRSSILLAFTTNSTVTKSDLTRNTRGIQLVYSSNNTISGNNITKNGFGISLDHYSSNTITENNINNNDYGIRVGQMALNNSILGNNITNNNRYGIGLYGSNNSVSGNNIGKNSDGIYLSGSYNTIYGNNITENDDGVYTITAFNNTLYHNNFINNVNHVHDWSYDCPLCDPSINVWDNDFPSGGNYWSDYTGVDFYSGPDQDQLGSDGIGDTAYIIDENNQDNYPLMNPFPQRIPDLTVFGPEIDGLTVTVNGVVLPGTLGTTVTRIHWDWGDGNSEDHWFPASHTYTDYGDYEITVTAYQSDGLTSTKTKQVSLRPPTEGVPEAPLGTILLTSIAFVAYVAVAKLRRKREHHNL